MNRKELIELVKERKSFLCVGLDSDLNKIPKHLLKFEDPIFEFNKRIIDATYKYCIAYKPNLAFYESNGLKGWQSLEKIVNYIRSGNKKAFLIADAKRGDIGNTSEQYAKAFFETMNFDAITVAPYMGEDSVVPFYKYNGKWIIILALTSNKGAFDFQFENINSNGNSKKLFETVIEKSSKWGSPENTMYVVGATKADMLEEVRKIIPNSFLLVPGVGAQGGSLEEVVKHGINIDCGLIVNASRSIIYASQDEDFELKASLEAQTMQNEMELLLRKYRIV